MAWKIIIQPKVGKQLRKLPERVSLVTNLLCADLADKGAYPRKQWSNYGKLHGKKGVDERHCHLNKGHPTYVACWRILNKQKRMIEVYYVGTHEKAPY